MNCVGVDIINKTYDDNATNGGLDRSYFEWLISTVIYQFSCFWEIYHQIFISSKVFRNVDTTIKVYSSERVVVVIFHTVISLVCYISIAKKT